MNPKVYCWSRWGGGFLPPYASVTWESLTPLTSAHAFLSVQKECHYVQRSRRALVYILTQHTSWNYKSNKEVFRMKTSACRDGTLKNQTNKMGNGVCCGWMQCSCYWARQVYIVRLVAMQKLWAVLGQHGMLGVLCCESLLLLNVAELIFFYVEGSEQCWIPCSFSECVESFLLCLVGKMAQDV